MFNVGSQLASNVGLIRLRYLYFLQISVFSSYKLTLVLSISIASVLTSNPSSEVISEQLMRQQ